MILVTSALPRRPASVDFRLHHALNLRMSWRKAYAAFAGIALVAALVAVVATLSGHKGNASADVLVVGQAAEPRSLDPGTVTSLNDFRIIVNVFDRLVRFEPGTLRIGPSLAKSWEVSGDGLTYTFRLRDGVRFHDGTALDAEAVSFSLRRMLDPDHPFHNTSPFPLAFFYDPVSAVRVTGPLTIEIVLEQPFAPLLAYLAHPAASIVSPSAVRTHGKQFGRRPVGSGPFRFDQWDSRIRVVLTRNEHYWDGAPASAAVVFRPILDSSTRLTELIAGQIDVMLEVQPDEVDVLERLGRFRLLDQLGPHLWYLILNVRSGPLADVRVRQAVNHAIDKRSLVENVLRNTAVTAAGPIPEAFGWAYAPPPPDVMTHDPERARALLAEAGAAGAPLTLLVPQGGSGLMLPVAMATAIEADLGRVGLQTTIRTMEWNTYLAQVNDGLGPNEDMAAMAWMVTDPDTLPYLTLRRDAWPEAGGFNSGYYANLEVDRLIEAARRSTGEAARADLYRAVQHRVRADAPWAAIASWTQTTAVQETVHGLRLEPCFELRLKDVRKAAPSAPETALN